MQCPITSECWQQYHDTGDSQVAQHVATCPRCRAEVAAYEQLHTALTHLTACDATEPVMTRLQQLDAVTAGQTLECADVQLALDAWAAGELDPAQAFLIDDHVLWCEACATEQAHAVRVQTLLHALPVLPAPTEIAARIAAARVPWWQRLSPAPAPSWTRAWSFASGLAAALLLACGLSIMAPRVAQTPNITPPAVAFHQTEREATIPAEPREAVAPVIAAQPSVRPQQAPAVVTKVATAHPGVRRAVRPSSVPAVATGNPDFVDNTLPEVGPATVTPKSPAAPTVVAAASDTKVEYSAERDLVARTLDERMTEIDESNAAAAEKIRRVTDRPKWAALSSSLD